MTAQTLDGSSVIRSANPLNESIGVGNKKLPLEMLSDQCESSECKQCPGKEYRFSDSNLRMMQAICYGTESLVCPCGCHNGAGQ